MVELGVNVFLTQRDAKGKRRGKAQRGLEAIDAAFEVHGFIGGGG